MLQQTTIVTVKDYYIRFVEKWPTVDDLAAAPLEDILKNWAGLGYYARARNLHACAQNISMSFGGIFPHHSCHLLKLSGIGPYTSAAIAAICFDEKIAVIDGNVERVMARYLALEVPVKKAKPLINNTVQNVVPARAGDFAQGMMDLGATICTPANPDCNACPLSSGCAGFASKNPTRFPIKSPKKKRPVRYGHAFVIVRNDGAVLLQKRPEKGLLALMSEVPGSVWGNSMDEVEFPHKGDWQSMGQVVHIFTHFRLELEVFKLVDVVSGQPVSGWWSSPEQLGGEALPSVFRKVLVKADMSQKPRQTAP
jgi:A/G-specific adenine glycosylase